MSKIVLIDGHSILNRAFYGVPDLTNSEGLHTNAVFGFLNILFMILEEESPDHLAVAFDVHAPTFRHEIYPEYKGTRHPMPDELREQVPLIQEVLRSMKVCVVTLPGYEADDVLGTIAKRSQAEGLEVSLVSGDRDLLQISDKHIKIRIPKTKGGKTVIEDYYPEDVAREYGVSPQVFIDMKALMGDSSDNIKGVTGVGPKSAARLLQEYGDIDSIYAHMDDIKKSAMKDNLIRDRESAYLARRLVTIKTDAPVEFTLDNAGVKELFNQESYTFFKKLEFKNFLKYFDDPKESSTDIEGKIKVIDDLEIAESFFNELEAFAGSGKAAGLSVYVPVDTVTGEARACAICKDDGQVCVIMAAGLITPGYLRDKLRGLMGHEDLQLYTYDSKKEFEYFDIDGLEDRTFDILIASYLLDPLRGKYDYEYVAGLYLDMLVPSPESLIGKEQDINRLMEEAPGKASVYLGYIAYITFAAAGILKQKLEASGMYELFKDIEMPTSRVLASMEKTGVRILPDRLKSFSSELKEQMEVLEKKIYDLAGEEFNILSPKQLGVILFEKMGLKGGKKTKTGYSTSADVLEKMQDQPIVSAILEYRQLSKLKSTYADGLMQFIRGDRIYSTFHQTVTATGRLSSADPNLQNIPARTELGRQIRKAFVPSEGNIFTDADYSQIELRILAHMAGDRDLIEAYREGQDIHTITASKVFKVPVEQVDSLLRRRAKAVNFGIVYGISSYGLSEDIGVDKKEAAEYIENYFKTYPGIKKYLDDCVQGARDTGAVSTLFGRIRPIPELSNSNYMQRMFGERVAMNSPIQGTAADIMKIAMIRVWRALKNNGLKSRLILQVHDELIIDTVPEESDEVGRILKAEMEHAYELKVPLLVDMHTGSDWDSAK